MAIKLKLENKNHSSTAENPPIYINDVVKNIRQDENLATNLESSSLLWKVTIPHDDVNIPTIIKEEEWKAELYYEWEDEETHIIHKETYFTGYLSDSVSWVIDQNGQSALQVTLEDNGVHLLKQPYTKDESEVIRGKFSSVATGDLGVVQKICNKAGISYVSNPILDDTLVECVADPAEPCESLLKSVCKEFCVAYSFNSLGELYLIPLSHTDVEHEAQEEIDDTDIYDSINLSKKTVTYKGSRIEWDDLDTINQTLVYRDISKPSGSTAPDCEIPLTAGGTYPSRDGANTYIKACDIVRGADVFSITNLTPEISWTSPGAGTSDPFRIYGANEIELKITCTSSGTINKLQAYADLRYVKSKNVVYGKYNTDTPASITEALREEKCRWIHSSTPAEKYANFLAQYDRYCNRTFTFKAKATYNLGQVIHLHENVHTGLTAYLMITKRTRTLTGFNTTTRTFTGIWTYEAVSMSNFDFSQGVTTENLWVPPSTTYVDVSGVEGKSFTLSADKSTLIKDNHSSSNQTLTITSNISGDVGTIDLSGSFNDGTTIPVDPSPSITGPYIHVVTAGSEWEIRNIPEDTQYTIINIHGAERNGSLTYDLAISFLNKTETFFFGALASDPAASVKRVTGDYYLNTTDGKTYEWNGTTWVACEDADKLLEALHTARHQNPPIDFNAAPYKDANTVSWFNTILAAKGIIDNLFSRYITILDRIDPNTQQIQYGCIRSEAYDNYGNYLGPGQGFFLNSQGVLKCDSGEMNGIGISGDSFFHGNFDCDVIKTRLQASDSHSYTDSGNTRNEALNFANDWVSNGWLDSLSRTIQTKTYHASTSISSMPCEYVKIEATAYDGKHRVQIHFLDSNQHELNLSNYTTVSTEHWGSGSPGIPTNYITYEDTASYKFASFTQSSLTITLYKGGNRLEVNLPDQLSAYSLSDNWLFAGPRTTTTQWGGQTVAYRPVYMKVQ